MKINQRQQIMLLSLSFFTGWPRNSTREVYSPRYFRRQLY
jgi:hypothetical protein